MSESFAATDAAKIMKNSVVAEHRSCFFPDKKFATDRITNDRFHKDHLPVLKYVTLSFLRQELAVKLKQRQL